MANSKLVFAFVATFFTLLSHYSSSALELNGVVCNAKLPIGHGKAASMYDGDDTIYVFGGVVGESIPWPEIQTFKYSISQDTLTPTAEQPPFLSFGGGIVKNKLGNIYYLVGKMYGDNIFEEDIWQFFPETETFASVGKLLNSTYSFGLVQPDEDTALIIGGRDGEGGTRILKLNLNTLESERLNNIPKGDYAYETSAIWVEEQGAAFIFDGRSALPNVTKFYPSENRPELIQNFYPRTGGTHQAVYDGKFGYIIGVHTSTDQIPIRVIIQFNPTTGDVNFVPVHGHPGISDYARFHGTSVVYVEKLNRIYTFGGLAKYWNDMVWRDIVYMSLDDIPEPTTQKPTTTLNPEIFNCVGLGDAVYPYPGNCEKFVLCRNDHASGFDCPEPLRFHPIGLWCTWPDLVDCE